MQAVILAAGYGTRMGTLTEHIPKALLSVQGKNLLQHKIQNLPESCTEVVLVIGYKGEKIRDFFGTSYNGKRIRYVEDETVTGTAHALWQAKSILTGRFLVMMGDDLYDKKSLKLCTEYDFSIVCKRAALEENGSRVIVDERNQPIQFVTYETYKSMKHDGGLIFTGLYSLSTDIFTYDPVKMKTKEEWSLPSTLLSAGKDHSIKIIETDTWISINSPEELEKAKYFLS